MDTLNFRLFPEQASTVAPQVDAIFWFLTALTAFFTVLIAVVLLYLAIRYRRRDPEYIPTPLIGSKRLEVLWSVIPLCLALFSFFWGARVYLTMMRTPDRALEVYVVGKQWMWQLQHSGGAREINTLHVPVGQPIKLIITSEDVLHDFFIPAFRVKFDAVPGRYTYLWFEATKTGEFPFYCALYCGTDHSRMIGKVVVMEPAEYEKWLSEESVGSLADQGQQLFRKYRCITCHHAEGGARGPLLEGLYGRSVPLTNGREVVADDAYIRESILVPSAKVRAGYRPIMPPFQGQIKEVEVVRLLAFIKALKPGGTPRRVEDADAPEADPGKEKKNK